MTTIDSILDLARWAPSGDNVQSWQFEVAGPDHVVVHGRDTRHDTVYDLDGHPSQISFGALLETMAIAASAHGLRADIARRALPPAEDARPVFDVRFVPDASVQPSPLLAAIKVRSVQRRPMKATPLSAAQKQALADAVGPGYRLRWLESFDERLAAARLMYDNARLRLTMPEAYEVHRRIIDWGKTHSEDKVPDQALGVDNATLKLMKWAMVSWQRLSKMNALMGTWAPRLQMDLVPGLACSAHVSIEAAQEPQSIDDYVAAGRAVQRFWLTLTAQGYFLQPEMTPLIFTRYASNNTAFTAVGKLREDARALRQRTQALFFKGTGFPVFIARVGAGPAPAARSLRKPVSQLMYRP
ncbi:molybdopterin biosynthesis protein MoeY [Pseudoduganella sp. UC29_106]|uniref:molybdopterin biosynthesis protein MoeY n=1 Tax=Pseudoduganella sp. UC29_106 TaxID=3374553 RepID=UPI0037565087